ncbi:MAG: hypothetical protein FJ297_08440 [Planctomycetes bacterium]|nr:hypothetical protein [Planctomycetota bacterium]
MFESVGSDVEPSEDDDVASDESRDFAYGGFGKGRDARGGRKAERRTPEPFDSEDDSEIASDLDDDSEHDDEVRPKHTKIPTWEQAVRVIIETNTANRAKSTPHANRGRGRRR